MTVLKQGIFLKELSKKNFIQQSQQRKVNNIYSDSLSFSDKSQRGVFNCTFKLK